MELFKIKDQNGPRDKVKGPKRVFCLIIYGVDVILGSTWLTTLRPHVLDYAALTLKFFQRDKFNTLQGEGNTKETYA